MVSFLVNLDESSDGIALVGDNIIDDRLSLKQLFLLEIIILLNITGFLAWIEKDINLTKRKRQHKGVDLKARHEYPVAMMYGRVLRTGFDKRAGNIVTLQHSELTVSYCHLSKILVKKDDVVYAGTRVGLTGSTGRSTGEHLHLTIRLAGRLINPSLLFKQIQK